jgi:biotin carboxylase
MRRVLVLGAGVYQVPLIRRALKRGLYVIACSYRATDPGMRIADDAWVVDTRDRVELLGRARANAIDAVITSGSDVPIPSVGHINDSLGLRGISYETGLLATNKILMKRRFRDCRIPAARFVEADSVASATEAVEQLGFPAVIKPPASSGSRGVRVVSRKSEIVDAFHGAVEVAAGGTVLVEEYLAGEEFGAQAIVINGETRDVICHNDTVTLPPVTVPVGHSVPYTEGGAIVAEATRIAQRAVSALGIRDAICNCDFILTDGGVRILEIGARIGATGIPEIIYEYLGLDLWELALDMLLDEKVEYELKPSSPAAIRIIEAPSTGKLKGIFIPDHIRNDPDIKSIELDHAFGSDVRKFAVGPDRIGQIVATGASAEEAERKAQQALDAMKVSVSPIP